MKRFSENINMSEGVIWKQLLLFTVPLLLSNLFQYAYNAADSAVVGSFVGMKALAAVGSTGSVIALLVGTFLGISSGVSVVAGTFFGAKDGKNLGRVVQTSMMMGYALGIVISAVGFLVTPQILRLMQSPDDVIGLSIVYLRVYFIGVLPMMVYNIGSGVLRAVGDSFRPLIYLVISGVTNVILNFVFVLAFGMGVSGVAWATVVSQVISCVLVLIRLIRVKDDYRYIPSRIKPDFPLLCNIIKIGLPCGLQSATFAVSNIIIQTNINAFGSIVMAGGTAAGKIHEFVCLPFGPFGLSIMSFTSVNIGAKKTERIKKGFWTAVGMCAVLYLLEAAFVFLFMVPILNIFTGGDTAANEVGVMMASILTSMYFIYAFTEMISGLLRGTGDAFTPLIVSTLCICGFRIVWIAVMQPIFHTLFIVVLCYPLSWILSAICFFFIYFRGRWFRKIANE